MPNTPIEQLVWDDFSGGVNRESPRTKLEPNEVRIASNAVLTPDGSLVKRLAIETWSGSHNASLGVGHFLFSWDQLGSANDWFIYVDADGDVFDSVDTDWSDAAEFDLGAASSDQNYPVAGAAFENVFYLTSLRANPRSFDGTNWTELTDITLDGDGGEFPKASFLLAKHDRMFAANIINNATAERSRIRWSTAGDAQTWATASWLDVNPDDGSEITGLVSFADGILIFKNHSLYFLSGVDDDTFTLYPISTTVGTTSPKSIAPAENVIYFYDGSLGVYSYDGSRLNLLSRKINSDLLSAFTDYEKINGLVHEERYYLSDGGAAATWVFDTQLEAWTTWTSGWQHGLVRNGAAYVVGHSFAEGIFTLDNANYTDAFNGDYAFQVITGSRVIVEDSPTQFIRVRGVDVQFIRPNTSDDFASDVTVTAAYDTNTDDPPTITYDMDAVTEREPIVRWIGEDTDAMTTHSTIAVTVGETTPNDSPHGVGRIVVYFSRRRAMRKYRGTRITTG